jgi:type IV secretory pathway VirB9-like protein
MLQIRYFILTFLACSSAWAQEEKTAIDIGAGESDPYRYLEHADIGSAMPGDRAEDEIINLGQTRAAFDHAGARETMKRHTWHKNMGHINVRLGLFSQTMVQLPDDEKILLFAAGDEESFTFALPREVPNTFVVKGLRPGADTTLVIKGETGRDYAFYLRTDDLQSKFVPHLLVYIDPPALDTHIRKALLVKEQDKETTKEASPQPLKSEILPNDYLKSLPDPESINDDYMISVGKKSKNMAVPCKVYDDGNFTYLDYRGCNFSGTIPAVYKVSDGKDVPVQYHYQNDIYVLKSVSVEGWTLIDGEKHVCIRHAKSVEELNESVKEQGDDRSVEENIL